MAISASALVVLPDGALLEVPDRARVSRVLGTLPGCAVCDADEMELGACAAAMGEGEEFRAGGIYFALPRAALRRRLELAGMASLAARASAALVERGYGGVPLGAAARGGGVAVAGGRGRSGRGLGAIPEDLIME